MGGNCRRSALRSSSFGLREQNYHGYATLREMHRRSADRTILSESLLEKIGVEIAKLHLIDIIHGDLTTSNMLLRASNNDLVRWDKPRWC